MKPIFKVLYRIYRLVSGLWYWTQRRFTRAGLAVLGALVVAGMMGPDTDNNVTYQGFTVLFFLLAVAVVCSWFFRARFSATRLLPRFGTVGCPLSYKIILQNLTSKSQRGLTLLETLADPRPSFSEWLTVQLADERQFRSLRLGQRRRTHPFRAAVVKQALVPPVPPNQAVEAEIELTPLRRGLLHFTGVALARPDPLGLFRSFVKVPLPQSALVLPKRYLLPPLALPGTMKYQPGGVALASNVGQSEEFVALRDYRQGDPLRHIHWRTWARAGKPVVKEFEDEFFVRHALVLDTFTDHRHGEAFEEAVSVAASFACTIQSQESLLDLLFVGPESYCFTAGRGLGRADQMLEILASVQPCRDQPFRALEHLVLNHVSMVSGCICVLLDWEEERRKFVEKLKALKVPVLVLVIAQAGRAKPLDPGPMRADPERFRVLECGKIEEGLTSLK